MRGHEPLLALRRRGFRPDAVWLWDYPQPKPLSDGTRMDWWAFRDIGSAEVTIEPTDHPARADLRFVVGLQVHVMLPDPDRMRAFVKACKDAGAARVFGSSQTVDLARFTATEVASEEA